MKWYHYLSIGVAVLIGLFVLFRTKMIELVFGNTQIAKASHHYAKLAYFWAEKQGGSVGKYLKEFFDEIVVKIEQTLHDADLIP